MIGDGCIALMPRTLAVLAADEPQVVEQLFDDDQRDLYFRWACASVYPLWVRMGQVARDDAIQKLRDKLDRATSQDDDDAATFLVYELYDLHAHQAMPEIRRAYEKSLVDDGIINLEVFETMPSEEEWIERQSRRCPVELHDTVAELKTWQMYKPRIANTKSDVGDAWRPENDESDEADEVVRRGLPQGGVESSTLPVTIHNTAPKVGRNDPCPCGSGKKFKKCCGGR